MMSAPVPVSLAALRTACSSRSTTIGARPSDSSSASSTRGRRPNARASVSICCSPPDSSPPRVSMHFSSSGNSAMASATDTPPQRRLSRADMALKTDRSSVT